MWFGRLAVGEGRSEMLAGPPSCCLVHSTHVALATLGVVQDDNLHARSNVLDCSVVVVVVVVVVPSPLGTTWLLAS